MKIRLARTLLPVAVLVGAFSTSLRAGENEEFGALKEITFNSGETKKCLRANDIQTIAQGTNQLDRKGNIAILKAGDDKEYKSKLSGSCQNGVVPLQGLQIASSDGYLCEYEYLPAEEDEEACRFGAFFDSTCSNSSVSDRITGVLADAKNITEDDRSSTISLLSQLLENERALCDYDRSALYEARGNLRVDLDFGSRREALHDFIMARSVTNLQGEDLTRINSIIVQLRDRIHEEAKIELMCSEQRKAEYSGLDTRPLVRVRQNYPARCISNEVRQEEIKVTVQFDISSSGTVENVCVVDTTDPCFNLNSEIAVSRWKYQQKSGNVREVRATLTDWDENY